MWIFQSRQIITRADKSSSSYLVSLLIFIILLSLDITLSFVERACPIRVQSIESWAKAVTPSTKLCYVPPFPGLLSSFFALIDSEFSEQASRQVATEEPKMLWAEWATTKILKEKTKLTVLSLNISTKIIEKTLSDNLCLLCNKFYFRFPFFFATKKKRKLDFHFRFSFFPRRETKIVSYTAIGQKRKTKNDL